MALSLHLSLRRVLAAEAVSNFGSMLSRLAIPWLAALVLRAEPWQMALLLVADVLAAAVGGVGLAGWIDRRGKRAVMLLADAGRCVVLGLLALLVWRGAVSMAWLVAAAAASGLLGAVFELARSAWIAQQVPADRLPDANARLSVVGSVSETAAFALGGWLYQALGAALALLCDALSYAVSALCLKGVDEARAVPVAVEARHPWAALRNDVTAGFVAIRAHPALRALLGIEALLALAMALTGTAYMIHVSRDVGLPTGPIGMIAALGAIGAVVGASLAPRLGRAIGPGRTMTLGLLAFAAGAACIPMAQHAGWAAVAWLVAHQIVGDAGHVMHGVHDHTLRQTAAAPAQLARVDAGIRGAGQAATLLGAALAAALGTLLPARGLLWCAAAVALAAAGYAALRLWPAGAVQAA